MRVSLAKAPLRLLLAATVVLLALLALPPGSPAQGQQHSKQGKQGKAGKSQHPHAGKPSAPAAPAGGGPAAEATPSQPAPDPVPELECNRKVPKLRRVGELAVEPKVKPKKPIEFSVRETNPVLSFGSKRGVQANYIVLSTSEPIPKNIFSKNFEIDSLEPLRRITTGGLESIHLDPPTYTRPHIFNHRREIGFNLCVSARGGEPGSYNGQFQFVGPGAIATATLTQTAQLKAEQGTFEIAFFGVAGLAFVLLLFSSYFQSKGGWSGRQILARLVVIVLSLVSTLLAMLVAFSESPTWGENLWLAVGALIATAFGAAGLGNTITAAAEKITSEKDEKPAAKGAATALKKDWNAVKGVFGKLRGGNSRGGGSGGASPPGGPKPPPGR